MGNRDVTLKFHAQRQSLVHVLLNLIIGSLLLVAGTLYADWNFSAINSITDQRYGQATPEARQRIAAWQALMQAQQTATESQKLESVNRFFNDRIAYREDIDVWQQEDYWATPIEMLRKGMGDCEDYAIAKYLTLIHLGVEREKLRITYVKALSLNRAHMVLSYYPSPNAIPLILDSLITEIRPATQRKDLLPVYSFNGDGLWLPGSGGNRRAGDSKRLSRWQDLLIKMRAEGFSLDE